MSNYTDEHWMNMAYQRAQKAMECGEVPVGAVLVKNNQLIGEGYNQPITSHDPTAHAEVIALRVAGQAIKNYRLVDTIMYVTLEPCPMCASALVHARIAKVIFATQDERIGACGSIFDITNNALLNHRVEVESGMMAKECRELIQSFFIEKRKRNR